MMSKIILGALFASVLGYNGLGEPGAEPQCPRECDHICVLSGTGTMCACRPGFRLYDDLKTCVMTEALLEETTEELKDEVTLPVIIVLIVGFLVILCMAIVTWYCVTRESQPMPSYGSENSLPVGIKTINKPLHISIV